MHLAANHFTGMIPPWITPSLMPVATCSFTMCWASRSNSSAKSPYWKPLLAIAVGAQPGRRAAGRFRQSRWQPSLTLRLHPYAAAHVRSPGLRPSGSLGSPVSWLIVTTERRRPAAHAPPLQRPNGGLTTETCPWPTLPLAGWQPLRSANMRWPLQLEARSGT